MSCGPDVRIHYASAGGQLGTHLNANPQMRAGTGFFLGAGAAAAYNRFSIYGACTARSNCDPPASFVEGVAAVRLGYDWIGFGLHVGALVWLRPDTPPIPVPDVALRFGDVDGPRFVLGVGAYDVPTLLRPGLYLGFLVPLESGWRVDMHLGGHLGFGWVGSMRLHAGLRMPIGPLAWVSLGAAVWTNVVGVGPEGNVGFGTRF
jgi:hypothetical protein